MWNNVSPFVLLKGSDSSRIRTFFLTSNFGVQKFWDPLGYKFHSISFESPNIGTDYFCLIKSKGALLSYVMYGQSYPIIKVLMNLHVISIVQLCNITQTFSKFPLWFFDASFVLRFTKKLRSKESREYWGPWFIYSLLSSLQVMLPWRYIRLDKAASSVCF